MLDISQHTNTRANDTVPTAPWQTRLSGLTLGPPRRFGGLCLYPLIGDDLRIGDDLSAMRYHLLDTALTAGTLTIAEQEGGGTVPELAVTNRGDMRVLIVDGEELVGAKQNRIVNTSVLVEAHSTLALPVSCVEAGRWHGETAQFSAGGSQYNARGRQKKVIEVSDSLRRLGRPAASQSRVWSDIHTKLDRLGVSSHTAALHEATVAYGSDLSRYQTALAAPLPRQVGAAFALGNSLIGLDLFDQAQTLAALLPKLVASYALDALEERTADAPPPSAVVAAWLEAVSHASPDPHPAAGLGQDVRLSGPKLAGAALECEGVPLHLSAFQTNGFSRPTLRMSRPLERRG
jgi:hypothetical protein